MVKETIRRNKNVVFRGHNKVMSLNMMRAVAAIELRYEGYDKIEFDKIIEYSNYKACVHVVGEDPLGIVTAIYCINRREALNPNRIMDVISLIEAAMGDECEVVLAIPLELIDDARDIIGITKRTFLIDRCGRVWVYSAYHGLKPGSLCLQEEDADEEEEALLAGSQMRPFYIA
jgi:hypothetical protein